MNVVNCLLTFCSRNQCYCYYELCNYTTLEYGYYTHTPSHATSYQEKSSFIYTRECRSITHESSLSVKH